VTDSTAGDLGDQPNEILATAAAAKAHADAADAPDPAADQAKRWPVATISLGVGIGSAALAAAALYASRRKRK
jgi:hypothetical protein